MKKKKKKTRIKERLSRSADVDMSSHVDDECRQNKSTNTNVRKGGKESA